MDSDRDLRPFYFFILVSLFIISVGLFTPISTRIQSQIDNVKTRLFLMTNNPHDSVFIPVSAQTATANAAAGIILSPLPTHTDTPEPTATVPTATPYVADTPEPTATITPTATATETPYPLPRSYRIDGVKYETQHGIWNYCAPTNLSMALTFWGWRGDRSVVGPELKPFNKDKNVNPVEMVAYVNNKTDYRAIVRNAGTPELLKKLIIHDFPVLIEKGSFMQEVNGTLSWMGHFNVVTGYDDDKQQWIVQDSYYEANWKIDYALLEEEWITFNNLFLVVYPGDLEGDLYEVLGPYTNGDWANKNAYNFANHQIDNAVTDEQYYYAYFNRGDALVDLHDYAGAAAAFDTAFSYYYNIEKNRRPYRMLWYRTSPYAAYYYTGRYQDIMQLAMITIDSTKEPYLEETYYWRALAFIALGDYGNARNDLDTCLDIHPGYEACETAKAKNGF